MGELMVLDEAKQNILTRLSELEPLRREYDELEKAAGQLGLEYQADAHANGASVLTTAARKPSRAGASSTAARSKRAQGRRRGSSRKIAPAGQRRQQMLDAITATPGITVKQVADQLGLPDATSLYRVQRQLVDEGVIRKEGSGMHIGAPAGS